MLCTYRVAANVAAPGINSKEPGERAALTLTVAVTGCVAELSHLVTLKPCVQMTSEETEPCAPRSCPTPWFCSSSAGPENGSRRARTGHERCTLGCGWPWPASATWAHSVTPQDIASVTVHSSSISQVRKPAKMERNPGKDPHQGWRVAAWTE